MERLKKIWNRISHNFGLKLLALASAFLIWIGVVNSTNPVDVVTFYNIPVKVINEDALISKDKIPEIVSGETVTVSIEARKSICDSLTENDIFAIADFSKINVADSVPIEIAINGHDSSDVEIIKGGNQFMKLSLEDYATKEFRVKVNTVGTPASGYVVGNTVASPNVISVHGSKMQLSRIRDIVVNIDVTGASSDRTEVATPVIYDMNDEPIMNDKLELSDTSVTVSAKVYKTKVLPIKVQTSGTLAKGYEITNISVQPTFVTVAGTEEELWRLGNSLTLTINTYGASANVESNKDLDDLIDSSYQSIIVVDEDTTLAATVYVAPLKQQYLSVAAKDITVMNTPDGFVAECLTVSADSISLQIGKVRNGAVSLSDLNPFVDLSEIKQNGIFELPVRYTTLEGVTVESEIKCQVSVKAQAADTESKAESVE